jgi:Ti-type conjugative transfer relaxase TraA
MLSMRDVGPDGFGAKNRTWNAREVLEQWRERWGGHVNQRLAELGLDVRVDHRTLEAQGIGLEPQHKIGPAGARREDRGETAERAADHRAIARRNGERIIAEPTLALDAITHQQSTFTDHDVARFVHRHTDDAAQFSKAMSAVRTSPEFLALGKDGRGRDRFTTREMLTTEERMERTSAALADRRGHRVSRPVQDRALASAQSRGLHLGQEQADALRHVTGGRDLTLVVGYAGSGKSAMLGAARDAWEAEGYQVRGAALSGIAAESLEGGSGIASRTIASLEHAWGQGREQLTSRDVLVVDEAGMIGSRQMDRVLAAAERAGAKVVLVGDAEQLQAIEAGAAFRALTERHGAAEITQIRRQREDWQRDATRELATGRTAAALDRYEAAGTVQAHATRDEAKSALVAGWDAARRENPNASQIMLAHTRADVAELNDLARARRRDAGELGADHVLKTERGERAFAAGDRLMFLRNERSLGVKNGSLGTVEAILGTSLTVRLDGADRLAGEARRVSFDLKDYALFDHGYASTIHKSQGVTVDRAHLLATEGLDRHAAYVGMSRHRDALAVHYGADDFKDRRELARVLGRERAKDITLDYRDAFADRRGIQRAAMMVRDLGLSDTDRRPSRGMFANFRPAPPTQRMPSAALTSSSPLDAPVRDYTRAVGDILRMRREDLPVLPHQRIALERAQAALAKASPHAPQDLKSALQRRPELVRQVDQPGGVEALVRAMSVEAQVRRDPQLRADRFIEDWTKLSARREQLQGFERHQARAATERRMSAMIDGLGRDAELYAALDGRRRQLGLNPARLPNQDVVRELQRTLGRGRGLER